MDWTKFPRRHPNRVKIHELSKTRYDLWVSPPSINELEVGIKSVPKHFGNVMTTTLVPFIFNQLKDNDPLFLSISPDIYNLLRWSIEFSY